MKLILFFLLITLSFSYTVEDHILILSNDDFPSIFEEFSHILIEFYSPK